ncbi:Blue-light-activated histidine kinase [Methylobacterium longum]|nr:Blue-light-activated histidine kinase [Methylobacterium longum]
MQRTTAQTLALALHELATNARKYGALSDAGGRLSANWQTNKTEAGQRHLVLNWVEEGIARPTREQGMAEPRGYGRELIEKALPYALRARTSYDLSDKELHCRIELPLS